MAVKTAGENRKPSSYSVYRVVPYKLGDLQWDGVIRWTDEYGEIAPTLSIAADRMERRWYKEGRPLEPGRYRVDAQRVITDPDRVFIVTTDGFEIVIYTGQTK